MGTVPITKEGRKQTFSKRVWGEALRRDSVSSSTVASTVRKLNASSSNQLSSEVPEKNHPEEQNSEGWKWAHKKKG